jgi:hypothetical protein
VTPSRSPRNPFSSPRTRERLADVGSLEHLTNEADPPDERQRDEGGTLHEPQCDQVGLADGQQPHVVVANCSSCGGRTCRAAAAGSRARLPAVAHCGTQSASPCGAALPARIRPRPPPSAHHSQPRATAARRHRPEEGERPFQTTRAGRPSALRRRSPVTEPTPAAVPSIGPVRRQAPARHP